MKMHLAVELECKPYNDWKKNSPLNFIQPQEQISGREFRYTVCIADICQTLLQDGREKKISGITVFFYFSRRLYCNEHCE
jgi:hypothetical protein